MSENVGNDLLEGYTHTHTHELGCLLYIGWL